MAARGSKVLGLAAILALASGAAQAEDLDKGKSAAALFAASCASCHSSPRGLAKDRGAGGLASYLQEHYTSGPQTAASLAAYLIANPGTAPRGKQQPAGRAAEGATKQGEPKTERQTHPPQTATMRPDALIEPTEPRRPETTKGKGKRQQTKQEAPLAPAAGGAESAPAAAPAAPAAPAAAPAAPVAAAPASPDQPAFSAPSP